MKPFERFSRWGSKGISETAEAKYNSHISINSIARKASIWFISFPGCNESLKRILRFCLCGETITKYPFRTLTLSLRFWVATERAISKDSQLIGHESYSYSMSKSCINISFLSTVPRAFRIEFFFWIFLRICFHNASPCVVMVILDRETTGENYPCKRPFFASVALYPCLN